VIQVCWETRQNMEGDPIGLNHDQVYPILVPAKHRVKTLV